MASPNNVSCAEGFKARMAHVLDCLQVALHLKRPPAQARVVHIDAVQNTHERFPTNYITTSKYNLLTFLPKNLFEQFRRLANFYFLLISALQLIPGLSPTGKYTTLLPLCIVLAVTAIKEAYEDIKRHRQDKQVNLRWAEVWRGNEYVRTHWQDIKVGEVVRLHNHELIPADIVLLTSNNPQGIAYVETSQLDGETNLKQRQSREETVQLREPNTLHMLTGAQIKCETPNNRIHTFEGTLYWGSQVLRLEPKQVLLRGCCLRNTHEALGVVIFTGPDTKLMMNQRASPLKRSNVEVLVNRTIIFLFIAELVLAFVCAVGSAVWLDKNSDRMWYIHPSRVSISGQAALNFLTFVILFNNLIPISLYVSIEIVRMLQAYFINADEDMLYRETHALARTSNLNEELGQVQFIFSDKTGTLTQNVMQFRKCSIAGVSYGRGETEIIRQVRNNRLMLPPDQHSIIAEDISASSAISPSVHIINEEHVNFEDDRLFEAMDTQKQALTTEAAKQHDAILQFLTLMAICHTVVPEADPHNPGATIYQASSPDEQALVSAARAFGFIFSERTPHSVTLIVHGERKEYEILNTLDFNGARKRMSVIVRTPEGKLILYCKGADTVIFQRLAPQQPYADITIKHLQEYASDGLRTLCLSFALLDPREYEEWSAIYAAAVASIGNREAEIDKAAELIEKNLFLLGATAIEDKLQEGVPETIHDLADANVKIWMLTGDKQETAVNIGFACQLLTNEMTLLVLNEETPRGTTTAIDKRLTEISTDSNKSFALVIDSQTLDHALLATTQDKFVRLAQQCKAVICCRCTPLQKASVVKLIRDHLNCITLAVGDGANDVSMIQSAHVGIGISGEEGLQAARNSDYSIAQFRFLKKLLLVHGRYSYRRTSTLILYTFYRNIFLYMTQFWYVFLNGFSGQSLYDRWTLAVYNVVFTFIPILAFGIFDKDVGEAMLYTIPRLFSQGQNNEIYNYRTFFGWIGNGLFHSLATLMITYAIQQSTVIWDNGWSSDLYSFGHTIYTIIIITVFFKLFFETHYWTWVTHLCYWGCLLIYMLWVFIYGIFWYLHVNLGETYFYLGYIASMSPQFWLTILIIPTLLLSRDVVWKYMNRIFWPKPIHIAQEIERCGATFADMRSLKLELFAQTSRHLGHNFSQNGPEPLNTKPPQQIINESASTFTTTAVSPAVSVATTSRQEVCP